MKIEGWWMYKSKKSAAYFDATSEECWVKQLTG